MFISKAVFTKNLLFVLDIITMTAMFIFAAMMLTAEMLMGPLFQINQTNRFIFIHGHMYPFASQYSFWPEAVISRLYADSSASCWSCHCISLPSFPSYVDNYHTSILCRSQWVDLFQNFSLYFYNYLDIFL